MKNKILTISIIFILVSCLFINNVFASSSVYNTLPEHISNTVTDSSQIPEISNTDYRIFTIFNYNYGYFCFCIYDCSEDFKITLSGNRFYVTGSANFNQYTINKDTGVIYENLPSKSFLDGHTDLYHNTDFYFKNIDIYNSDGTIFFQQPPEEIPEIPEETITEQTVLTPILEKVEMKETITTTIVGLAVLLIPLLICLLGFWKAWRLLLKILHKS